MVSVERIREYQATPQEAAFYLPDVDPEPSWPHRGEIEFVDYATRYRDGMDLVLRGVSFRIHSEQKARGPYSALKKVTVVCLHF